MRPFGIESEYASNTRPLIAALHEQGYASTDNLHRYHCTCDNCDHGNSYPWKAQTDSTVDGEIISHIFTDWDDAEAAVEALCATARDVGATSSASTGVHVHVAKHGTIPQEVALAYFLTERFFTEIVAPGSSRAKREMNTTLLQATRSYIAQWGSIDEYRRGNGPAWFVLTSAIEQDRHVDLNISTTLPTFEFRTFNGTLAGWRMMLAARMSVALVETARQIISLSLEATDMSLDEILTVGLTSTFPTKRPLITLQQFVDVLCGHDPAIRPLIDRQTAYMRFRYRREVPAPADVE